MGAMHCRLCGYTGGAGESQCPECGAPLFDGTGESAPAEEVYITNSPPAETAPRPKGRAHPRLRLAAGFLAAALAAQAACLWQVERTRPNPWCLVDSRSAQVVTDRGVWQVDADYLAAANWTAGPRKLCWAWQMEADGEDIREDCYFYDGRTLAKTDWAYATLSGDGQVLFYVTQEDGQGQRTIVRRDLKTGRETEIARGRGLGVAANSDDAGTAMAYYSGLGLRGSEEPTYYYSGLEGLKNGGADTPTYYIWQAGSGSREVADLPAYLGAGGESYLAYRNGPDDSWNNAVVVWPDGHSTALSADVRMDRDLTEVLYPDEDGLWHYEDRNGRTKTLDELPRRMGLQAVRAGEGDPYRMSPRLTDQVYQVGTGLYYLDAELNVTALTSDGAAGTVHLTADGQSLYFIFRSTAKSGPALWQLVKTGQGDWQGGPIFDSDGVQAYVLSQDGRTLCVRYRENNEYRWKIRTDSGEWEDMENVPTRVYSGGDIGQEVRLLDNGGCWYLNGNSNLRKELWYRAPDGRTKLKMAYTSPFSDTVYPDEDVEVLLSGFDLSAPTLELVGIGSGEELLARVEYTSPGGAKQTLLYSSFLTTSDQTAADYWLLSADGGITKLEAIEP